MFKLKVTDKKSGLDDAIDKLLTEMASTNVISREYSTMMVHLTKLCELKRSDAPKQVSPDTIATIAGNLFGIILILGYERAHVITSKALNFVLKTSR